MRDQDSKPWTWILVVGFVVVSVPIGVAIVLSIIGDADMLVDTGGWWMLLLFLVVPALAFLYWLNDERTFRARWRGWRQRR